MPKIIIRISSPHKSSVWNIKSSMNRLPQISFYVIGDKRRNTFNQRQDVACPFTTPGCSNGLQSSWPPRKKWPAHTQWTLYSGRGDKKKTQSNHEGVHKRISLRGWKKNPLTPQMFHNKKYRDGNRSVELNGFKV